MNKEQSELLNLILKKGSTAVIDGIGIHMQKPIAELLEVIGIVKPAPQPVDDEIIQAEKDNDDNQD